MFDIFKRRKIDMKYQRAVDATSVISVITMPRQRTLLISVPTLLTH